MIDHIMMYEQIEADLAFVYKQLGIAVTGYLGVRAKTEYRKDRRHYRDVLSTPQVSII